MTEECQLADMNSRHMVFDFDIDSESEVKDLFRGVGDYLKHLRQA